MNRAAAGGHLEVMKFALANGCEWEFTTLTTLIMCEDPAVKKWAKEHGAAGVCADFSMKGLL